MPQAAQNAREGEEDNGDIPSAFAEDLTLREMKASFKSNKGPLTRLSNQVKVRAETFVAIVTGICDPAEQVVQVPG